MKRWGVTDSYNSRRAHNSSFFSCFLHSNEIAKKYSKIDNYFDKLESAQKCKNNLIKKRETDYKIRKMKEKDKVFK